ncbi:thioredoxin domain-containing protein [Streptacidiphilus griseoplanus]|uniref:thioredoxin domain-containing protein n=1 Tax=Peterkaempfera griseoplana TaxID=66896 RepID=UPI0006E304E5|nr:thioredoxin domain-containing protein [Peterkaempfera griseoplana]
MARYQRARVLRATVAVAALVAAVAGETAVGRALADRAAHPGDHARLAGAMLTQSRALPAGGPGGLLRAPSVGRPVAGPLTAPAIPGARPVGPPGPRIAGAATLMALPARLDPDGVAMAVGSARAPVTLTLYEDYRDPGSRRFEQAQGRMLADLAADGTVWIRRITGSAPQARQSGEDAHRAANAARAALAAGRFPVFNALLYQEQPPGRRGGFTVRRLLDIASQVPGLRSPAFDRAVRTQRYASWVATSQRAYDRHDRRVRSGSPGMVVGGRPVDLAARPDLARDPAALRRFLLAARG